MRSSPKRPWVGFALVGVATLRLLRYLSIYYFAFDFTVFKTKQKFYRLGRPLYYHDENEIYEEMMFQASKQHVKLQSGLLSKIKGKIIDTQFKSFPSRLSSKKVLMNSGRLVKKMRRYETVEWFNASVDKKGLAIQFGDSYVRLKDTSWAWWGSDHVSPFFLKALYHLLFTTQSFEMNIEEGQEVTVVGNLALNPQGELEIG